MSYYPTLAQDITRAREIIASTLPAADIFAATKILESFIEAIEAVGTDVCEVAVRAQRRRRTARPQDERV